jgi:hypothetical protein
MDPAALEDRLQRLKELVPRLLALQPRGSVVAALFHVMATALVELEEAIDRTLHDHWLALANGETEADQVMAILLRLAPQLKIDEALPLDQQRLDVIHWAKQLERVQELDCVKAAIQLFCKEKNERLLAVLADLPHSNATPEERLWQAWSAPLRAYMDQRQRSRVDPPLHSSNPLIRLGRLVALRRLNLPVSASREAGFPLDDFEEIEAYRRRIRQTVSLLGVGATNPQALLRLAITTLGAEVCGRMRREHDTWIGYGLPPGRADQGCLVCASFAEGASSGQHPVSAPPRCPLAWFEVRLIDNPLRAQRVIRDLGGGADQCAMEVLHPSISETWPSILIEATHGSIENLVLENRASGEQLLFADTLSQGQQLRILPSVVDPQDLMATNEPIDPYPWRQHFPEGCAQLGDQKKTVPTDVSIKMWLFSGSRFAGNEDSIPAYDVPRFGYARFGFATSMVRNEISMLDRACFGSLRLGPLSASVQVPRLVPGVNVWRYASYGKGSLSTESLLARSPLEQAPGCTVSLEWWSRPPASFRLEVEPIQEQGGGPWLRRAERIGALAELRRQVERIRPAGVRAEVRLVEALPEDRLAIDERPFDLAVSASWQDAHPLLDVSLNVEVETLAWERHDLLDPPPLWGAVLNVCRWDQAFLQ